DEMEGHCPVKKATHAFYGITVIQLRRSAGDPLERLVNGIGISEDVVGGFPVGMFVGGAETRHPERCCIGKRATDVVGRGPSASRGCERVNDRDWIVSKKPLGQQRVF